MSVNAAQPNPASGGPVRLADLVLDDDEDHMAWQSYANCLGVDPDLFFPQRGESIADAKAVCADCVVKAQCLEYALERREKFGVWGGTSERERRRIRRVRAAQRQAQGEAAA